MANKITVTPGERFGRLTVVKESERQYGHRYILVRCDCGNEKTVNLNSLVKGMSKSCGCYRSEFIGNKNLKHGLTYRGKKIERLYQIWVNMKRRCCDPKDKGYHNYGERGITVCPEWLDDYATFRTWALENGYADDLTIDRIDNDKGYFPDNCRWSSMQVQSNNTRFNRRITYNGETHTMAEWERLLGFRRNTVGQRLRKGLPLEQVFFNGNLRYYGKGVAQC